MCLKNWKCLNGSKIGLKKFSSILIFMLLFFIVLSFMMMMMMNFIINNNNNNNFIRSFINLFIYLQWNMISYAFNVSWDSPQYVQVVWCCHICSCTSSNCHQYTNNTKQKQGPSTTTQPSPLFLYVWADSNKDCAWVYRSLHVFKRQSVRARLIFEYLCVFEGGESWRCVCVSVCLRADGMADGSPYGYSFKASLSKGQQDFHYNRPLIFITLPSTNTHREVNTHTHTLTVSTLAPTKAPVPQHTHADRSMDCCTSHKHQATMCLCFRSFLIKSKQSVCSLKSVQSSDEYESPSAPDACRLIQITGKKIARQ